MIGLAAALSDAGMAWAVIAESADTTASVVQQLLETEGDFGLLVIGGEMSPLDRAMLVAAIGVLAVEFAPARRIGAVIVEAGAAARDIIAAASFLKDARSTTGQILTVVAQS